MFEIVATILLLMILFALVYAYTQIFIVVSEIRAEVRSVERRHAPAIGADVSIKPTTTKPKLGKESQEIPPEIMAPSILKPPRPSGGFGSKIME